MAVISPTVLTYIGTTPGGFSAADGAATSTKGSVNATNVAVTNNISSNAQTGILALTAGGVGVSGNILMAFNRTDAYAAINGANVNAGANGIISVNANMDAVAKAYLSSLNDSGVAVGASVSYVHLRAGNYAQINLDGASVAAKTIRVNAGTAGNRNTAEAVSFTVAGNMGGVTVGVNSAIADNEAQNVAQITGSGSLTAHDALFIGAYGKATAEARIIGLALGAVNVAPSFAVSVLRSTQKAEVTGGNISAKSVSAVSELNNAYGDDLNTSKATLQTGGGSIIGVTVNVAVAYGRSSSIAGIGANNLTLTGGAVNVSSTGKAGVKSLIQNQNFSAISAAAMVGVAYAQGTFHSYMNVQETADVSNVNVSTNHTTKADADVAPSLGGVNANYLNVSANIAVASVKSNANAYITGSGSMNASGAVKVTATGVATAVADVQKPYLDAGKIKVAATVMVANQQASQKAYIENVTINGTSVTVSSSLNDNSDPSASVLLGNRIGGDVNAGLVSAKANVGVANANATSHAYTSNANLLMSGAISVTNTANSIASAKVDGSYLNLNAIGLGVNVLIARADGSFGAFSKGGSLESTGSSISMTNTYTAKADAVSAQPSGGVGASLGSIKTNIANARVGTVSETGMFGCSALKANGSISAVSNATAQANASVENQTLSADVVKVAVNVVKANVGGSQSTSVDGAVVEADSVKAESNFNTDSNSNDYAANATVGSTSGTNVQLAVAGMDVSTANATISAKVSTVAGGSNVNVDGALEAITNAKAFAKAGIYQPEGNVQLYNISVLHTEAKADGSFKAGANIYDSYGEMNVGSVNVYNNYLMNAYAQSGQNGGLAADVADGSVNIGKASADGTAEAYMNYSGTGNLHVTGDVEIAFGKDAVHTVVAEAISPTVDLNGLSVTVNQMTAHFNATQRAFLTNNGTLSADGSTGIITIGGALKVDSAMKSEAKATVHGPQGSVSGIKAEANLAKATSQAKNESYVNGSGELHADTVDVLANQNSTANALAEKGVSISLFTVGQYTAEAYSYDDVYAGIKSSTIRTNGTDSNEALTVYAKSDTNVKATSTAGNEVHGINVQGTTATAQIGESSSRRQQVRAEVGSNAKLYSATDVNVKAYNTGYVEGIVRKGKTVSLGSFSATQTPTQSFYATYATIGDNAVLKAEDDIFIKAEEYGKAKSDATESSIGITVNVTRVHGENTIDSKVETTIGNSDLIAGDNLDVRAESDVWMYANTHANTSSGFLANGDLYAKNKLIRNVLITLKDGSHLEADFGNVNVIAQAGAYDDIETLAKADSSAAIATGKSEVFTDIISSAIVKVEKGVSIKDTFGTVTVYSNASEDSVYSKSEVYNRGLGNHPVANATNTVNLTSKVDIGSAGSGTIDIIARNVEIYALMKWLNIDATTRSRGKGLGVNIDATSKSTLNADSEVTVADATIKAFDYLTIRSEIDPSGYEHIDNEAYAFAQGIGSADATTTLAGKANTRTEIKNGVNLYGAYVTVESEAPDLDFEQWPHTKRTGFASADDYRKGSVDQSRSLSISSNTKFHIGDAAAGIAIDVSNHPTKSVRIAGLPGDSPNYVKVTDTEIIISALSNAIAGRLTLGAHDESGYTVYNQAFIPQVNITNRTDKAMTIGAVTVQNVNFVNPTVVGANSYTLKDSVDQTPTIVVESRDASDVHVSGLIANQFGEVFFIWTGEEGGKLSSIQNLSLTNANGVAVSPVWTHELGIVNAGQVGDSAEKPFQAYLFYRNGKEGFINASVSGSSYLSLTPLKYVSQNSSDFAETLGRPADTTDPAFTPVLTIGEIVAGGMNDITISNGFVLYNLEDSVMVSMPTPGTLLYASGYMMDMVGSPTLDAKEFERYLQGYDLVEEAYVYVLPTGATIYVSEEGRIIRITEITNAGTVVDVPLSDYRFFNAAGEEAEQGETIATVQLASGVKLDLGTGQLTLEEGAVYETLLDVIKADAIMNNEGRNNKFRFAYVSEVIVEDKTEYQINTVDLSYWKTEGDVKYYWLQWISEDALVGQQESFLITYNTNTNTLSANVIGGKDQVGTSDGYAEDEWKYFYDNGSRIEIKEDHHSWWDKYMDEEQFKDYLANVTSYYHLRSEDWTDEFNFVNTISISDFLGLGITVDYAKNEDGRVFCYGSEKITAEAVGNSGVYVLSAGTKFGNITLDRDYYFTLDVQRVEVELVRYTAGYVLLDENGNRVTITEGDKTRDVISDEPTDVIDYWHSTRYVSGYNLTMNYTTARDASIGISPIDPSDENTAYYVEVYETRDESENAISGHHAHIDGPIDELYIKETDVPKKNETGYRINDQLYITSDGEVVMLEDSNSFMMVYDGENYDSNELKINYLKSTITGGQTAITLKPYQMVTLEWLTDCVAAAVGDGNTSIAGNQTAYYLAQFDSNGNVTGWVTMNTQTGANGEILVTYGGVTYLTITEGYNDNDDLTLYYTIQDGTRIGSDGSVVSGTNANQTQRLIPTAGESDINLGTVQGSDIVITMLDNNVNLIDDNGSEPNIIANGNAETGSGSVVIQSESDGSIGTAADRLEIESNGDILFKDLAGNDVLKTDTYITTDADLVLSPNLVVDGLGIAGETTLDIVTTDGANVSFDDINAVRGGLVNITADGGIIGNELIVSDVYENIVGNAASLVNMTANTGNIEIKDMRIVGESDVNLVSTLGSVSVSDLDMVGGETSTDAEGNTIFDSNLTIEADQNVNFSTVDVNTGAVNITASGSMIVDDTTDIVDSAITAVIGGDVSFGNEAEDHLKVDGSEFTLTADGSLTVTGDTEITGSELNVTLGLGENQIGDAVFGGNVSLDHSDTTIITDGSVTVNDCFTASDSNPNDTIFNEIVIEADGSLTVHNSTVMTDSVFKADLGGNASFGDELTDELALENSNVTLTADGSLTVTGDTAIADSIFNADLGADIVFTGDVTMNASRTEIDAEGSVTLKSGVDKVSANLSADDSETIITTGGAYTMDNAQLSNGSFTVTANDDLIFGIIEARENDVHLTSVNGSIFTDVLNGVTSDGNIINNGADADRLDGYIRFTDEDDTDANGNAIANKENTLVLSAGADIGKEDHSLIIDIAADEIIHVTQVEDYYIDAVELVGAELYAGMRPEVHLSSGTDENGKIQTGDFISDAATETIYVELKNQLNAEIANKVVSSELAREEWSILFTTEAVANLIRNGDITADDLADLLVGDAEQIISAEEIQNLILQGDNVTPEETFNGFEKLANLLIPQFTAAEDGMDEEGNSVREYIVSAETLEAYLKTSLDADTINIDAMAAVLSDVLTDEEIADLIQEAWNRINYEDYADTRPDDPAPREVTIEVGESTGSAYVNNEGSITITQEKGTLTAGAVHSDRGDVTLVSKTGGIEGDDTDEQTDIIAKNISLKAHNGVGAETPLTTEQRDNRLTLVTNILKPVIGRDENGNPIYSDVDVDALDANGQPTDEEKKKNNPKELWALETFIDLDWLRVEYPEDAMRLDVEAGNASSTDNDVNIIEVTGDMGLGSVEVTNGDASLTASGNIVDNRTDDQKEEAKENLTVSGGNAALTAQNGEIGKEAEPTVGEDGETVDESERIITDVSGTITAIANGDISIADTGSLNLIADHKNAEGEEVEGQVNASAENDLTLRNLEGDMTVGPIEAGGTAIIVSEGSIIEGDSYGREASVTANTIDMTAKDGHIGTEENAFEVNTDAENDGTLSANGNFLNITETDGDLTLKTIVSDTDAIITAPGGIFDGNENATDEAAQAQKDANKAQAEADKEAAESFVENVEAQRAQEALNKAEEVRDQAQEKLNQVKETLDKAEENLEQAEKAAEEADKAEKDAQDQLTQAREELESLQEGTEEYQAKLDEIETLESELEAARENSENADAALDAAEQEQQKAQNAFDQEKAKTDEAQAAVDAAKEIADKEQAEADQAKAEADAAQDQADALQQAADQAAEDAAAQDPTVTVGGDLTLNAGDAIGEEDDGLNVQVGGTVDANTDDDLHLNGNGDLTVEDVDVSGKITINVIDGNLSDNGGILKSDSVDVSALGGDVGSKENPLAMETNRVDGQGNNVYIENLKDTTIGNITADDELVLDSQGDVTGDPSSEPNISADDATINADGNIGSEDDRLDTNVDHFHGNADDIYLDNEGTNLDITDVNADTLDVVTNGNVTGEEIKVHDIIIDADGFVGEKDDPFTFWADGYVSINGGLGIWWRNLYRAPVEATGQSYPTLLVLRFELTIGGREFSLYALVRISYDGKLELIGFFLCEGEADQEFWTEVFKILRNQMGIVAISKVIHHEDEAIEEPAAEAYKNCIIINLSDREEEETLEEMALEVFKQLTKEPEQMLEELKAFYAAVSEQLAKDFESEEELREALAEFEFEYFESNDAWLNHLEEIHALLCV